MATLEVTDRVDGEVKVVLATSKVVETLARVTNHLGLNQVVALVDLRVTNSALMCVDLSRMEANLSRGRLVLGSLAVWLNAH